MNQIHIATVAGLTLTIQPPEYFKFEDFIKKSYDDGYVLIPNAVAVSWDKILWIAYGAAGPVATQMPMPQGRPN